MLVIMMIVVTMVLRENKNETGLNKYVNFTPRLLGPNSTYRALGLGLFHDLQKIGHLLQGGRGEVYDRKTYHL